MELRHLRYFVAVAEEQNVTRAAEKLRIAQPAVSRQVRDLEDELGIALLERNAKSIRLTDAGRLFLDEARAVLQRADEAVEKVRAIAIGAGGELHVGYAPSLTARILPRALRRMQTAAPRLRILLHDLSTEEMFAGLREGRLQVALMVQPTGALRRGLHFRELARYAMCVAVPVGHPLARNRFVSPSQIAKESLVAYSREDYPEYHVGLAKIFSPSAHPPKIAEEHDSVTSLIAAVEAGRGMAIVPECLACLAGPRLELLPLKPAPPALVVGAAWFGKTSSRVTALFIDAASDDGNPKAG